MNADDQKRAVGEAAAAMVEPGMTVGLGTGTTAAFFVRALGARARAERLDLRCTATSQATAALGAEVGLQVLDLDEVGEIDLTIDGADEVGPGLALIKGGGAALLREKLVWEASRRCVAIADASKRVERLGAFGLPVEVVAFGHRSTARRLASSLGEQGFDAEPALRMSAGAPLATDSGNVIYDLPLGSIADPPALARALKA
ncbi:MAG: ribose-5-phosphate isomerase RpiA, partial [Caulobacteraceae bacterium]|nr:ribose-5-phosphate isomerase RpiA [Caulobacter sp.]